MRGPAKPQASIEDESANENVWWAKNCPHPALSRSTGRGEIPREPLRAGERYPEKRGCMRGLIAMVVMVGCVGWAWGEAPPPAPPTAPERQSTGDLMRRNGGSLFRASLAAMPAVSAENLSGKPRSLSFFAVPEAEPKVLKKHDLVTIIIRESTEMTSDANSELKKNADLDAKLQYWTNFKPANWQAEGTTMGGNPPGVAATGSRNFKGEAKVDRIDTFTTRIAAEVIDVKPNGTLAIQARKFIKHGDEEQEYLLTGVCRAADITPDNSILSTQVHNLEVITNTKGAVTDTTKRGFIPKLLDSLNPF